ncbi:uncharacterized protein LOC129060826 [Pongo abelii]|uniref:uncharacterized protein LOC129060826 n=1 Tax=Pongo abelii TaxID=9601 RepID=UPI0023E85936|nr:uncharacterized protein LOC129060826 [Pongo abelii]
MPWDVWLPLTAVRLQLRPIQPWEQPTGSPGLQRPGSLIRSCLVMCDKVEGMPGFQAAPTREEKRSTSLISPEAPAGTIGHLPLLLPSGKHGGLSPQGTFGEEAGSSEGAGRHGSQRLPPTRLRTAWNPSADSASHQALSSRRDAAPHRGRDASCSAPWFSALRPRRLVQGTAGRAGEDRVPRREGVSQTGAQAQRGNPRAVLQDSAFVLRGSP